MSRRVLRHRDVEVGDVDLAGDRDAEEADHECREALPIARVKRDRFHCKRSPATSANAIEVLPRLARQSLESREAIATVDVSHVAPPLLAIAHTA